MKFRESNGIMNIKVTLQYDGTEYHGWQVQNGCETIQQKLSEAIFAVTGEKTMPTGCGRTDSGVHAENYVCNFHTNAAISPERYVYALNAHLPKDIVCTKSEAADEEFCANRSAVKKRYVYRIVNSEFPNVFENRYAWHYKHKLDVEKMRAEAQAFLGEHDFVGFAASGFSVKTTVRTIYSIDIKEENNVIEIDVTGNGFLYNMVRIIAGTLVQIGGGVIRESAEDIINSKKRERAGITAPACGLRLKEVFYGE